MIKSAANPKAGYRWEGLAAFERSSDPFCMEATWDRLHPEGVMARH
jgi:hypothetical protein